MATDPVQGQARRRNVGYEFGCDWDDYHGVGVLMQETSPVAVGLADVASLLWKAEAHAETLH